LGEVKFVGAQGGESLSQALLRNPEGEVPKNRRQAHFDQPLREIQTSETAFVFAVYPIELHFQCWIAAAKRELSAMCLSFPQTPFSWRKKSYNYFQDFSGTWDSQFRNWICDAVVRLSCAGR
jgi:hypothetical protein